MSMLQSSQTGGTQESMATVTDVLIFKNKCVWYLNYSHLTMGDGEKKSHIPSYPTLQKKSKPTRGSLVNWDSELSLLCTQNSHWYSGLGSSHLLSYLSKTKGPNFVIAPEHPFCWITVATFAAQIICPVSGVCAEKNMHWLIRCFLMQNYILHSLKCKVYISFFGENSR